MNQFVKLIVGIVGFFLHSPLILADSYSTELLKKYNEMLESNYVLLPFKGTYLLPISYNATPNDESYAVFLDEIGANTGSQEDRGELVQNTEAEFQISFMVLASKGIWGTDWNLFGAYTQNSWWQLYNDSWSKPFRETNYMPEVFFSKIFNHETTSGLSLGTFSFGYVHQSNGQIQELSRSWDRLFIRPTFIAKNFLLQAMIWHRFKESKEEDDNPDIQKYLGYSEIIARYAFENHRSLALKVRLGELHTGYQLKFGSPITAGLRAAVFYTYGYGSSLLDYNHKVERIGVGITFADPFNTFNE